MTILTFVLQCIAWGIVSVAIGHLLGTLLGALHRLVYLHRSQPAMPAPIDLVKAKQQFIDHYTVHGAMDLAAASIDCGLSLVGRWRKEDRIFDARVKRIRSQHEHTRRSRFHHTKP